MTQLIHRQAWNAIYWVREQYARADDPQAASIVTHLQQAQQAIHAHPAYDVEPGPPEPFPHPTEHPLPCQVFAVGATPESAVRNLAHYAEWGPVTHTELLDEPNAQFTWSLRFTAGGTGFKAAGHHVPGGVVVTWWK